MKLILYSLLVIVIFSCNKDKPGTGALGFDFVSNPPFHFNAVGLETNFTRPDDSTILFGATKNYNGRVDISFYLLNIHEKGNYKLGKQADSAGYIDISYTEGICGRPQACTGYYVPWYPYQNDSGEVILETLTADKIEGAFHFKAWDFQGNTIEIANGHFFGKLKTR
jgi:hypothetical protein